jgi:hypothetical protein
MQTIMLLPQLMVIILLLSGGVGGLQEEHGGLYTTNINDKQTDFRCCRRIFCVGSAEDEFLSISMR